MVEQWFIIHYICPSCGHIWYDHWSCACNSECPECHTEDIEATSWEQI